MRCIACDIILKPTEVRLDMCRVCLQASQDTSTEFKDKQHVLITEKLFNLKH